MGDSGRGAEVRLEIRIDASPETVFALLTEPARMRTWLAELVEAESRPGGMFRISGPAGVSIEGTYLEVVPNRKVVFTWGGVEGLKPGQSTGEFVLEPDNGGTLGGRKTRGRAASPRLGLFRTRQAQGCRRGVRADRAVPERYCATARGRLTRGLDQMNWWLAAGGLMASICGAGHAIAGHKMFYLPIKSAIADELQAGVLTGMWHLITIHFALSAFALFVLSARVPGDAAAWLLSAQFAAYAAVYLVTSLRLAGALKLFQWIPFGCTAILTAVGAMTAP